MTSLAPRRSVSQPTHGVTTAETRNPNEKAPAVTPRSHLNSSRIWGNSKEKAVRALTPIVHGHEGNADEEPSVEKRQSDLSHRLRPGPSLQRFVAHDAIRSTIPHGTRLAELQPGVPICRKQMALAIWIGM